MYYFLGTSTADISFAYKFLQPRIRWRSERGYKFVRGGLPPSFSTATTFSSYCSLFPSFGDRIIWGKGIPPWELGSESVELGGGGGQREMGEEEVKKSEASAEAGKDVPEEKAVAQPPPEEKADESTALVVVESEASSSCPLLLFFLLRFFFFFKLMDEELQG